MPPRLRKWGWAWAACLALALAVLLPSPGAKASDSGVTLAGFTAPGTLTVGQSFSLRGTIYSQEPLQEVRVTIYDATGTAVISQLETLTASKTYQYSLRNIDARVKFGSLGSGSKRLVITARTGGQIHTLASAAFTVEYPWVQVPKRTNLDAYFGNESYRFYYQRVSTAGREITVDPQWVQENIVTLPFCHKPYNQVHATAQWAFAAARAAIASTIVTVQYDDGQVSFPLESLVLGHVGDGCYVPRLTQSLSVSGHSFGLTIDLNTGLAVNGQVAGSDANYQKILAEVAKLSYVDGITWDGTSYHTLRYRGSIPATGTLPEALMNYVLYELAFYPYGFYWGGYFSSTDAMHFTLFEIPAKSRVPLAP